MGVLSSDEAESSEDENDKDLDEMGKIIENMLVNKKSISQVLREREEMERKNLMKIMLEGQNKCLKTETKKRKYDVENRSGDKLVPKVMKITRTYKDPEGKTYIKTEIVRKPIVIDTYIRIRNTKDETFIKQLATLDEAAKKELKTEKNRILQQLKQIHRNEQKEKLGLSGLKKSQKRAKRSINAKRNLKQKSDIKLKCGACGQIGHNKTNRKCPMNMEEFSENNVEPLTEVMTETAGGEKERKLQEVDQTDPLVNVDGTIVRVSGKVVEHVEELRSGTMTLKIPQKQQKQVVKESGKENWQNTAKTTTHGDYQY